MLPAGSIRVLCRSAAALRASRGKGRRHSQALSACTHYASHARVVPASDTHDLMDILLAETRATEMVSPGASSSACFFFDIDETIVCRDTSLVYGFQPTTQLLESLSAKLGASHEMVGRIASEMERDYYNADTRLVDPLLARVIRCLKLQGHLVYGLTSNRLDSPHSMQLVETLARYKIRFSETPVRGELPRTGALVMEHPVVHGLIFTNNAQVRPHDKGEVIAEFAGLLHNCAATAALAHRTGGASTSASSSTAAQPSLAEESGSGYVWWQKEPAAYSPPPPPTPSDILTPSENSVISAEDSVIDDPDDVAATGAARRAFAAPKNAPLRCVLVDNTREKCEAAAQSFRRASFAAALTSGGGAELTAIHYNEAENAVDPEAVHAQFKAILKRVQGGSISGLIDEEELFHPTLRSRRSSGPNACSASDSGSDGSAATVPPNDATKSSDGAAEGEEQRSTRARAPRIQGL